MSKLIVAVSLFISVCLNINAKEFRIYSDGKYSILELEKHDGAMMNRACYKDKARCPYYSRLPGVIEISSKLAGHPAVKYCEQLGGNPGLMQAKEGMYDFCSFAKGRYLIDSWDLYGKMQATVAKGCIRDEISFSFENIKIATAYEVIADYAKLKLDIDKSVNYTTSLRFKCVPWKKAAKTLAQMFKLEVKIYPALIAVERR